MREAHALAWDLKWGAASQKYREALAEFPDDATARVSLAVALTRIGQADEALKEYLVVRQALPKDALVLARIAELHIRLGQREPGVQAYQELAALYLSQGEPGQGGRGLAPRPRTRGWPAALAACDSRGCHASGRE